MGKIVAIGGGEIGRPGTKIETKAIDKEVIRLTGKSKPNALFIPTASSDSESYYNVFKKYYGDTLNCKTDVLYLIKNKPSNKDIKEKINKADLIYVGGGNTLKMMNKWKILGVDKLLKQAYNKGTVLSGLSAGAICWFSYGHSDSRVFNNPDNWDYIKVKGLGLIDALACPHYNGETKGIKREIEFQKMIQKFSGIGLAIDNHAAIKFVDDKYRVITSRKGSNAYKVYKKNNEIITEVLKPSNAFKPLDNLLKK